MKRNRVFHLQTMSTSYIMAVLESGQIENLYYGKKIREMKDYSPLFHKAGSECPNSIIYEKAYPYFTLDDICLEYSSIGKGDLRESPCEIWSGDGSFISDFKFLSSKTYEGREKIQGLPAAHIGTGTVSTLEINLYDKVTDVIITLFYHSFYEANVITRHVRVKNGDKGTIEIKRLMSMQLDLPQNKYTLMTFDGTWAREMERHDKKLQQGIYLNDSKGGTSSNRHNPFIIVREDNCNEDHGQCYGFNLIYSGNHAEIVEVNQNNKVRILNGINPYCFSFTLEEGMEFNTPEAVLSFSQDGLNGLSKNMHFFVNEHIIPEAFKYKKRPILINNWEATYFDFNERKLNALAKQAAELGIELFVLDDGWFGRRNDDSSSLGDWFVNKKKLPSGLKGICQKVNDLGMDFGLWVEPEMISEDSDLYRNHSDWVVRVPERGFSTGRRQLLLDLTRDEVRDYLVERLSDIFSSANIKYIKWDMNRNFSDMYSTNLGNNQQGEFLHRYVLGLYDILERLTRKFPKILFEGCASGGNRFDLGILSYMPQIWTSDDTDAHERVTIQTGVSYGYPPSTMGAHVSVCPNHQTLRRTSIDTRFNVAAFGILGYELNLLELSTFDKRAIKEQVKFYKDHRQVLQFGDFYRVENIYGSNKSVWMAVAKDKSKGILGFYQTLQKPAPGEDIIKTKGLEDDLLYHLKVRGQRVNVKVFGDLINQITPVHIKKDGLVHDIISKVYTMDIEKEEYYVYGDLLNSSGFKAVQQFSASGYNDEVRLIGDFGSRLYVIESCQLAVIDKK